MNLRLISLCSLAVVLLAVTVFFGRDASLPSPPVLSDSNPSEPLATADLRYRWSLGETTPFEVQLDAEIRTLSAAGLQEQHVSVDATLCFRVVRLSDELATLEARFENVRVFEIGVDGVPVLQASGAQDALAAETIHLDVSPYGEITEERYAEGAPEPVIVLLSGISRELLPDIRRSSHVAESGLLGTGPVASDLQYSGNFVRIQRQRSQYDSVFTMPELASAATADGQFELDFTTAGRLVRVSGEEHAAAGDTVEWVWSFEARAGEVLPSSNVALPEEPGTRVFDGAEQALADLRLRVGAMTPETFLAGLFELPGSGRFADHNSWLYQAGGLLELHPELCDELASLVVDDGALGARAQILAVDLLSGVGNPEAHAALRRILTDSRTMDRGNYHRIIQSVALTSVHDEQTLRIYEDLSATLPPGQTPAALAMLGHLARGAAAAGDDESVQRVEQNLADRLAQAGTGDDRRDVLRALGNLATPGAEEATRPFLSDDDPWTRASAVRALRGVGTASAGESLWESLGDPHDAVRSQALRAIGGRLSEGDVERLLSWISQGITDGDAVGVIEAAERLDAESRTELLSALLASDALSSSTAERIRRQLPRELLAGR